MACDALMYDDGRSKTDGSKTVCGKVFLEKMHVEIISLDKISGGKIFVVRKGKNIRGEIFCLLFRECFNSGVMLKFGPNWKLIQR